MRTATATAAATAETAAAAAAHLLRFLVCILTGNLRASLLFFYRCIDRFKNRVFANQWEHFGGNYPPSTVAAAAAAAAAAVEPN